MLRCCWLIFETSQSRKGFSQLWLWATAVAVTMEKLIKMSTVNNFKIMQLFVCFVDLLSKWGWSVGFDVKERPSHTSVHIWTLHTWRERKHRPTNTQIHKYKYTYTNTQIQIHKYKYTNTNAQIQINIYKFTNINAQIQMHKYTYCRALTPHISHYRKIKTTWAGEPD